MSVNTILHNAKIATNQVPSFVEAVAISDGKISAAGKNEDILESLFQLFGGDKKPDRPMRMEWHNISFDEESQIGFGEYTFQMNNRYHGIVVVKLRSGKISNWREYQYKSGLTWAEFNRVNPF